MELVFQEGFTFFLKLFFQFILILPYLLLVFGLFAFLRFIFKASK